MKKPLRIHKSGFKVSPEQREEILRVYMAEGMAATAELCRRYGVSPKYGANLASIMGLHRPKWRAGNRYRDNQVDHSVRTHDDPRWAWAKKIGAVIA